MKDLTKQLGLQENIIFLNNISQEFKNAIVSNSNIFVMPSIIHKKSVEGFGIAFIEAAQYGLPSIGGKDGGASDAIIHEKTGLICDGNNLDDIYTSILNILEKQKYIEFGKSSKENSKILFCSSKLHACISEECPFTVMAVIPSVKPQDLI